MPRYIGQRDNYNCGPIAITNAQIWAGTKLNGSKMMRLWSRKTQAKRRNGVSCGCLEYYLHRARGIKVISCIDRPDLTDIDNALDSRCCVIVRKLYPNTNGHYYLIVGKTDHTYTTVNRKNGNKTVARISRSTLESDLAVQRNHPGALYFAVMWMIDKEWK